MVFLLFCKSFVQNLGNNISKMVPEMLSKFEYLLKKQLLTPKELKKAVSNARDRGVDVEHVLMQDYKIDKQDLGVALGNFYTSRFIPFDDKMPAPSELIRGLVPRYLLRNQWVPLKKENDQIIVLIDDPSHPAKQADVRYLLGSENIEFCVALKEDIFNYIDLFFGSEAYEPTISEILGSLETGDDIQAKELETGDDIQAEEMDEFDGYSSVVQLIGTIIRDAYARNASDIHIEPHSGKRNIEVRFRIDGACVPYMSVPYYYKRGLVVRLQQMGDLNQSERRLPQSGKIQCRIEKNNVNLRLTTVPTAEGVEHLTLRFLNISEPISLDEVGFSKTNLQLVKRLIDIPHGIFLVAGPPRSGKTTTLHSILAHMNKPELKIWTIEDPVEITQVSLSQVRTRPAIGYTFAEALRAFLSADADIIMVGELPNNETVETAIEAALSGHLILSSLRGAGNAPETVTRLLDMPIEPVNLADALLGIVAQRLVRTLCKVCKQQYHPTEREFHDLVVQYGEEDFKRLNLHYTPDVTLYRAKGCEKCNQCGYRGRTVIQEVFENTKEIKELIKFTKTTEEIRAQSKENGMVTLRQDGIEKVFKGLTDVYQVGRACLG